MNSTDPALRGLWLAIIAIAALVVALCAGVVIRASGAELPAALGAGGGTFAAAVTLGLTARKFLSD
jgi:hypothetical protein